ncbi:DNA primase [Pasteurellaceae bacterium LFhippo2]|nr:DNA primase [Pasteurellaceae bacterium LFhippo2]
MAKLTNAPFLKEAWNNETFSDLKVLVGSNAWSVWSKGKGTEWQMLADGLSINPFKNSSGELVNRYDQTPVILGNDQLEDVSNLRIAHTDQRFIKFIKCGELSEKHKTALCINLAKHTTANNVALCDVHSLDVIEDFSGYIQRLRTGESVAPTAEEPRSIKENDRTNEKARAFKNWLGLDIALKRGVREIFSYDGKMWSKLDDDDLEEKAVIFFDENDLGYSDNTINRIINTLKAQLPRMAECSNDLIAFNNGVLNRNTLMFEQHQRNNWITSCIPHNYDDRSKETPHFDKWLDFVSDGNQSKARNILACLYAILTNRYNWQIFFQVTGKGGSGKSVFANIATLLIGGHNTSSARLENFDDERGLAGLENKKLIICPEQAKYAGDGSGIKKVTGGDIIRVRYNYQDAFDTIAQSMIMLVNNEPCRWTDRNGGVERRLVNFSFSRVVPQEERDPHFMDKITLEVGGIIRKVLDTFPNPFDARNALEEQMKSRESIEIKMKADHLTAFFEYFYTTEQADGLFMGTAATAPTKMRTHLYTAYMAYTRAMNINELGLNTFVAGIEQALKQHNNKHDYIKEHTREGRRTNIHFKDFYKFSSEVTG